MYETMRFVACTQQVTGRLISLYSLMIVPMDIFNNSSFQLMD